MKILKIETFLLKVPLGKERFYSSQCAFPERNSLLVKITTDKGLTGWGECGQYGPGEPPAAFINHVIAPNLMGKNPLEISVIWDKNYALIHDFGRKCSGIEAISGIDIALWDIAGKYYKKPIYELLGGAHRQKIFAYATGCYYRGEDVNDYKQSLSALKDEAKGYIDAGFSALKGKVGLLTIAQDAERVDAIRNGIGNDALLMIDCNHAYNVHHAIQMGRTLESLRVYFFEEPVLPDDIAGYQRLRHCLNIAIAAGENEYTRFGYLNLLKNECLDIYQPNICCAGGFTELKRIEALTTAYHKKLIPHCWGSGVSLAATLHLCATLPPVPHTAFPKVSCNEPMIEYDKNINPLRDELIKQPLRVDDGYVQVPMGEGLGIDIDESILSKYCRS